MASDPATPQETGLTQQGLKDNAVAAGNKFVAAMIDLRAAVNAYNAASMGFMGAQAAFQAAGGTDEDVIEIAKGCLLRNGISQEEIDQEEADMRRAMERAKGPTNLDKARVL